MEITRRSLLQAGALLAAAAPAARPAPNDRIEVGIIGAGARGQELMDSLQQHPQAEIVGIVDGYQGRRERALSRTKGRAKIYATHQELLAEKSIDAVVIAIPDHLHKTAIVECLAARKDVYCEKPMTYRSSEGLEIIAAARRNERMMQVGSQGVSSDMERKAKDMIRAGKLGRITMIRAAYNRNTASGAWIYPIPPDASPETVNWPMFEGTGTKRPFDPERFFRWRCYQEYSGGIATDLFVHLCTTIHFLMDAKAPARVMAMGELYRWKASRDVPDTLNAILEYPEGFTVNLSSSFNNELNAEGAFQVLGTEGSLTIGGDGLVFYPENPIEDNRWIVDSWAQSLEDAYYKDPKVIATEIEPAKRPRKQPEHFKDDGPEPTFAHFGYFFDSVRTRQPYWEDATAGHHAAACAHMINQSAQEHRLVEWDFAKDDIKA
ncbi:MAG TPA: Gfo/Idh/MocA family oxidoreductase [Bryobacteraceae bacterium]|nr:Gfo/Idh/MocA family oxidoreductase [Bryobacteraceae bacterium]